MSDDSVTRFAQTRLKAAATLVQVISNENASDNARIASVEKILHYSDGRLGTARQVTVADVAAMSDEQRQCLLEALLTHFAPNSFQTLLEQACSESIEKYEQTRAQHLPRFQRGDPIALPHR